MAEELKGEPEKKKGESNVRRDINLDIINFILVIVVLIAGIYAFLSFGHLNIAIGCAVLLLVIVVINIVMNLINRRRIEKAALQLGISSERGAIAEGLTGVFGLPITMVRDDGKILYMNAAFINACNFNSVNSKELMKDLFSEYIAGKLNAETKSANVIVSIGEARYRMFFCTVKAGRLSNSGIAIASYFVEITGQERLKSFYMEKRTVIGEIIIDNYDDILQADGEPVMNQILVALSDKFDEWLEGKDAVVKRLTREKYILMAESKALQELENGQFAILEKAKQISVGNTIPVTLSIGISTNKKNLTDDAFDALCEGKDDVDIYHKAFGDTLDDHFSRCEELLNLALARGGDQAIIQYGDYSRDSKFYGGSEIDIDRDNKVKSRVEAGRLSHHIEKSDRVLIMGHAFADMDALGASLAVYRIAKMLGSEAYIVLEKSNPQIDVMYNALLKSGNYDDVFIRRNEALNILDRDTLVILVDTFSVKQSEAPDVLINAEKVAFIDHHRRGADFLRDTVFSYTDTGASSASELVVEMMRCIFPKVNIPEIEAEVLYGGILVDTKNMIFKTSGRTFEVAAFLRTQGANPVEVRKYIQPDKANYLRINHVVNGMKLYGLSDDDSKSIAFARCVPEGGDDSMIASIAADRMLDVAGVQASFVLMQLPNGVSIKARSLGNVNVQLILERPEIGGGGHLTAAAGFVKDARAEDMERLIVEMMNLVILTDEKLDEDM